MIFVFRLQFYNVRIKCDLTLFAHNRKTYMITFTLFVFIAFNMYCFDGQHWAVSGKIYIKCRFFLNTIQRYLLYIANWPKNTEICIFAYIAQPLPACA